MFLERFRGAIVMSDLRGVFEREGLSLGSAWLCALPKPMFLKMCVVK